MKTKIFVQTHLSDNTKYQDFIKQNFKEHVDDYVFLNINESTDLKNINQFARLFNEYCVYYYVYENKLYEDLDIISFCHYRRIIDYNKICFDRLISDKNLIQYYEKYTYNQKTFRELLDFSNLSSEYGDDFHNYFYLYQYFYSMNFPNFLVDDLKEYIFSYCNKEINKTKYNLSYENKKNYFFSRSIISLSSNKFVELMEFVNNYFNFISNKYKINLFDYDEIIDFYRKNIIEHYKKEFRNNPLYQNKNLSKISINRIMLFQTPGNFKKIFYHQYGDYGLNEYCNVWRLFGYIFEYLVNIFICFNNRFLIDNALHVIK